MAPHGLNPALPWAESIQPAHDSVSFMCCRVDGWLLKDSLLPTLGLSLLYPLMTLSLLCAAGWKVGSSWTQSCPSCAEPTLPAHDSVPFMYCMVDGWLLMDSILPTLGLSLLYLLMTLSLFMYCRVDGWLLMDSILPTLGLSLL